MPTTTCSCGLKRLLPVGPENSPYMIVGGIPTEEDLQCGMPFSGQRGEVLFKELALVGLQITKARLSYLRPHLEGDAPCSGDEEAFLSCLKDMKDKKGILIIGADACEILQTGSPASYCGLSVESIWIPKSAGFAMVTTQPPTADYIGEFRLSLQKFAKKLKEMS